MPEVVDEGVTGLLVSTVDQAVEAITRVAGLDRVECRARALKRFSADRMVTDYLAVYDQLVHALTEPHHSPFRRSHTLTGVRRPA